MAIKCKSIEGNKKNWVTINPYLGSFAQSSVHIDRHGQQDQKPLLVQYVQKRCKYKSPWLILHSQARCPFLVSLLLKIIFPALSASPSTLNSSLAQGCVWGLQLLIHADTKRCWVEWAHKTHASTNTYVHSYGRWCFRSLFRGLEVL